ETDLTPVVAGVSGCDLIVDALFGTGLSRPLEGHFAELIERLAGLALPVLAVDLPSGLDGSRDTLPGPFLPAETTVTFAAPKVAHIFPPAARAVGQVVVTDLGIPPYLVDEAPGNLHLLVAEELAAGLLPRRRDSHKGDFGHALLVAGSPGKAGAAILAARAAVRGGAGLVTVAVPEPILATVDGGSLESMTLALPAGADGALTAAAAESIAAAAAGKWAVAIGPGLGLAAETVAAVRPSAKVLEIPLVLDADGLNAFAGDLEALAERQSATVLTPHPGEMARLLRISTAEVQTDRRAAVCQAAERSNAVVVLKGHLTLIAEPGGAVYVNPTGNPGMASGGSGDVLTGLLAAFLAQGFEVLAASQLAAYLHGLAGDLASRSLTPEALRASDQIEALPAAFNDLRGE
ncbi:MAG: NAD(P)H-hydrate dehydratase, partial [Acidobacteriota bacterium]